MYKAMSGTSMATPIVSRLAGIILSEAVSRNETLSPAQVIEKIKALGTTVKNENSQMVSIKMEEPSWYGSLDVRKLAQDLPKSGSTKEAVAAALKQTSESPEMGYSSATRRSRTYLDEHFRGLEFKLIKGW
jgi:subtilisin family serine protease